MEVADSEFKTYGVYSDGWHLDLRVHDQRDAPLYLVDNSFWTPHKPDVTLHNGIDNTDPILGVARLGVLCATTVGIGDPNINSGSDVIWEDLVRESKINHSRYSWSMDLPGGRGRRTFVWKRTHHFGLEYEPWRTKTAWTHLKLQDVETGKIVANFARTSINWRRKVGRLVFRADYGETWEIMVLLTVFALIEGTRRRERAGGV